MVYKGCDVGSAKPSKETLKHHPHHLIDCIEPTSVFTVSDFVNKSLELIDEIHAKNKLPLFVGGSMMYFKSLLDGLDDLPQRNDPYRSELKDIKNDKGIEYLYSLLERVDPEYAKKINSFDEQRIVRALEVKHLSGKPYSSFIKLNTKKSLKDKYDVHQFAIYEDDRALLHKRIEERLHTIINSGLIDEVRSLLAKYIVAEDHPIRKSVNYKQAIAFINQEYDFETFSNKALFATRQLAKRQITWIRSWQEIGLYNINSSQKIEEHIKKLGTSL